LRTACIISRELDVVVPFPCLPRWRSAWFEACLMAVAIGAGCDS
jgi:hypothetical protein